VALAVNENVFYSGSNLSCLVSSDGVEINAIESHSYRHGPILII